MGKIEYLFYCAVLNGAVFMGELFVFYLAGKDNSWAAASFKIPCWSVLSLIGMWLAEVGVLVVWVIKYFCEKRRQPEPGPAPNGGAKAVTQTAEAKAIAVAKAQC